MPAAVRAPCPPDAAGTHRRGVPGVAALPCAAPIRKERLVPIIRHPRRHQKSGVYPRSWVTGRSQFPGLARGHDQQRDGPGRALVRLPRPSQSHRFEGGTLGITPVHGTVVSPSLTLTGMGRSVQQRSRSPRTDGAGGDPVVRGSRRQHRMMEWEASGPLRLP